MEKDALLTYQLYVASRSPRISMQRKRARWLVAIVAVALSGSYIFLQMYAGAAILMCLGLVWFLAYPMYSAWYYRRHYEKHVEEALSGLTSKKVSVGLNGVLLLQDHTAESKVKLDQIETIVQIPGYTMIMLSSGQAVTLPVKHLGDELDPFIEALLEKSEARFSREPDWEWK
tara:strand:- start:52216 stop:52734 length:519 start_codon:yes stop_codon:yes gene_type:complete